MDNGHQFETLTTSATLPLGRFNTHNVTDEDKKALEEVFEKFDIPLDLNDEDLDVVVSEVKIKKHYYAFGSELVNALDEGDKEAMATAGGDLFIFEEGIMSPSELLDAQDGWDGAYYLTEDEFNQLEELRS